MHGDYRPPGTNGTSKRKKSLHQQVAHEAQPKQFPMGANVPSGLSADNLGSIAQEQDDQWSGRRVRQTRRTG